MPKSLSQQIRDRLLAGEQLNASDISKEYHCSNAMLATAKKKLESEGYSFSSIQRREGKKTFVDTKLKVIPSRNDRKPTNGESAVVETVIEPVIVQPQTQTPALGATVTVSLLAVDEEGMIKIGIRNGKRTWLCTVVGEVGD